MFPNSFLIGGPADILVIELADQVTLCFNDKVYILMILFNITTLTESHCYDPHVNISENFLLPASKIKGWAGLTPLSFAG